MTDITVEYARPHMRGRKIFGDLVPYDSLWRTGANRNSKVTFSKPVYINGKKVGKGTYALITRPGLSQWEVYFYRDLTHWEVPSPWDEEQVAVQLSVKAEQTTRTADRLTFSIDDFTDDEAMLALHWENTRVAIPIDVNTNGDIRSILAGPSDVDYYRAAEYSLTWGKDLEDGLRWAQIAIEQSEKKEYWYQYLKAKILAKLGRYHEALSAVNAGLVLAKARSSEYGIKQAQGLIEKYEKALNK